MRKKISLELPKLLLLDVDGVLTDGKLRIGENGEMFKVFSVEDGAAIESFQQLGVDVGFVSASKSDRIIQARAEMLGVKIVLTGVQDKGKVVSKLIEHLGYQDALIYYIGDSIADEPAMRQCSRAFYPFDGSPLLAEVAMRLLSPGGERCVAELLYMCDLNQTTESTTSA